MFEIDRLLDLQITPENEFFILKFINQNSFFVSFQNLVFKKESSTQLLKIEQKHFSLVEEICKEFIKHNSKTSSPLIRSTTEDDYSYKRISALNCLIEEVIRINNQ